jgi:hypothetical protein
MFVGTLIGKLPEGYSSFKTILPDIDSYKTNLGNANVELVLRSPTLHMYLIN